MSSISGVSTGCLPRFFFGVVSPVFTRLRSWSRGTLSSRAIAETFAPSIRAALIAAPHSTKVGGRSRLLCEKLSIFGTLQTGPDSVATHCTEEEYPTWLRARFHGLSSSMRTFKQLSKIPTETNFFLELFTNPPPVHNPRCHWPHTSPSPFRAHQRGARQELGSTKQARR